MTTPQLIGTKLKKAVEITYFIEGLGKILGWLGFEAENIGQPEQIASRVWVSLKATVPPRCSIPVFGSESGGQYRVMCVWTWPSEDEILDWIDQKAKGQATIVFYFGRMTVQMRRDLARSKRSSFPSFLLIDEYQLLFLCAERGSRLPAFFDCAMPFARINPYTPFVPGNVPPEMFVGREQETRDLMDLNGTCFIYGGRQLGKTALLRYVEREFENKSDYKAIYLDLKTKPTGLWPALGKSLRDKSIILRRQKSNSSTILLDRIKQWLNDPNQPGRRVLLLLDESDDFLEKDAKEKFRDVGELKGLMEDTDRRFKVIFAGLHNVQRFSAIPNQPIAHLGKPLSIGPLTSRAARDLIVKPLRTLGYRFKDTSLVTTILFEMNRYPNLIQLFSNELLKHLRRTPFPAKEIPPYTILEKHIEEVYHSQDLRSHIRDRFRWTLDLDKRYRFIAYKFAYEIRAGAGDEGFTANWIADEARREWTKGFAETSHNDEIRGLLDEMTGLSILVKTQNNRYRLRSPNVLKLLGDDEEIERELIEITQYPPSPEFDPNSFRRPIDEMSQENRIRSPFTIAQEADILKPENDIRLIFGSEKLGIESVSEGVKAGVEDVENYVGQVHFLDSDIKSSELLRSWLQKLIDKTEEGHVVPIIPLERVGSEPENLIEWVEIALNVINRRRSERRPIRILFLIPPEVAQIWVKMPKEKREELTNEGGRELKLKRWNDTGLQHWLDGLIPPNTDEQRKDILNATGGWPIFVMEDFAKRCLDDEMPWKEVIKEIRETRQKPDDNLKKSFGLIQMDGADQVWKKLYDWCIKDSQEDPEPIDFGTLREFINEDGIENMSPEDLRQIIDYLDYMNLIEFENVDQICPELVAAKMTLEE